MDDFLVGVVGGMRIGIPREDIIPTLLRKYDRFHETFERFSPTETK